MAGTALSMSMVVKIRSSVHHGCPTADGLSHYIREKLCDACDRVLLSFEIRRFGTEHLAIFLFAQNLAAGPPVDSTSPENSIFGMDDSIRLSPNLSNDEPLIQGKHH